MEKGLFIIWNDSIKYKQQIINEINKIFQITYVSKKDDILVEDKNNNNFLKEFYWDNYDNSDFINRVRYTSKFIIILCNDLKPINVFHKTFQRGLITINKNFLDLKLNMRKKFGNKPPLCHASDDLIEFSHNLKIIIKYAKINNISNLLNYQIRWVNLLNVNKIFFLDIDLNKILSAKNKKQWNDYNKFLENKNRDLFCIDSSFIMALYNIREAADLSYISIENINSGNKFVRNHKNIIENNSKLKKSKIIFDPKYHFYLNGLKCLKLNLLKQIKKNRNTEKDKRDVILIDDYMK